MTSGRQWAIVGGIVGVIGIAIILALVTLGPELFPLRIGSRAPAFQAVTMAPAAPAKGLADYAGEVVLLNIWATWCAPCRLEMPSMQRLEERLGSKGLRIVAVSIDDPGMEPKIRAFTEELGLTFEILYDAPGRIRQQYQTTGIPETFIIGRDGRIRRRIMGADDWGRPDNIAFLERLLSEAAGG